MSYPHKPASFLRYTIPAALVVLLAACGGSYDTAEDAVQEASWQCEDFVEDRLKAPATAEFDPAERETTILDEDTWTFSTTGVVHSENGFGAMIATDYSCELTLDLDAEQWTLDDIKMSE